jgi:hypothetical protein
MARIEQRWLWCYRIANALITASPQERVPSRRWPCVNVLAGGRSFAEAADMARSAIPPIRARNDSAVEIAVAVTRNA